MSDYLSDLLGRAFTPNQSVRRVTPSLFEPVAEPALPEVPVALDPVPRDLTAPQLSAPPIARPLTPFAVPAVVAPLFPPGPHPMTPPTPPETTSAVTPATAVSPPVPPPVVAPVPEPSLVLRETRILREHHRIETIVEHAAPALIRSVAPAAPVGIPAPSAARMPSADSPDTSPAPRRAPPRETSAPPPIQPVPRGFAPW